MNDLISKLEYIDMIADSTSYCIACVESDSDCDECQFAEEYGKCCDDDNMYSEFCNLLADIMQQIESYEEHGDPACVVKHGIGKWEWIGNKIEELYVNAADHVNVYLRNLYTKAYEIDEILRTLYDNTSTDKFNEDIDFIEIKYRSMSNLSSKLSYILSIANNIDYCIACMESDGCECAFAKKYGQCNNNIYTEFINEMEELLIEIQ